MLLLISFMFERWTKKATDNAVENVKKTFNDRIEENGDIIKFGLVLMVIILGGKHLTKRDKHVNTYSEYGLPAGNTPIIINNYYSREEREEIRYGRRAEEKTQSRKYSQERQNRR